MMSFADGVGGLANDFDDKGEGGHSGPAHLHNFSKLNKKANSGPKSLSKEFSTLKIRKSLEIDPLVFTSGLKYEFLPVLTLK